MSAAPAAVRHSRFAAMAYDEAHDLDWAASLAMQMCRDFPDAIEADDLQQAARLACWQCSQNYDPSRGVYFRRYARDYVVGAVLMEVRRHKNLGVEEPAVDVATQPTQGEDLDRQKHAAELYRALAVLPIRERAVLAGAALMAVPMRLLARRMGCSLASTYVLRQRGMDMLRQRLDPVRDAWSAVNGLER